MNTSKVVTINGFKYEKEKRRYVLVDEYASNVLNIKLDDRFGNNNNTKEILDRVSRQFYNYIYDEKTWAEDISKKEYLILTTPEVVKISRDIMISHLESTILTRRDLLVLEHGIDFDSNKLIEDFDLNIEKYQFSADTRRIFNKHRLLKYKERLTTLNVDESVIGVGY
jgi:hypothetical protein